jgi:hypothetical protein
MERERKQEGVAERNNTLERESIIKYNLPCFVRKNTVKKMTQNKGIINNSNLS